MMSLNYLQLGDEFSWIVSSWGVQKSGRFYSIMRKILVTVDID